MLEICVIGFGARAEGLLRNFNTFEMGVSLTGVVDQKEEEAGAHIKNAGFDPGKVQFFQDIDEMLLRMKPDGVVVSTRCDSHTDIAVQVMKHSIPMLLEKPVAISRGQLDLLQGAAAGYRAETLVSFPLRVSHLCELSKEIIDSGRIGTVEQVQAVNNVTYGRVYYKDWYRNERITGGLFLQKATHDLDYINYILGQRPVLIGAMASKQVYKGNNPAGLTCDNCGETKSCPESPYSLKNHQYDEESFGTGCSFAVDTGNHDSASILTQYESGMHSVYTQNFIVRKDAAKRGARFIGYQGTLEFDWITGIVKVYSHTSPRNETYEVKNNHLFHYGGDKVLCENFCEVMRGSAPSKAPLASGILSAGMCLLADESSRSHLFYPIEAK